MPFILPIFSLSFRPNAPRLMDGWMDGWVINLWHRFTVRHTFFEQFVGGETTSACLPLIRKLRSRGTGALLAYSVEASHEDIQVGHSSAGDEHGGASRLEVERKVRETIEAVRVSGGENRVGGMCWVAVKLVRLYSFFA